MNHIKTPLWEGVIVLKAPDFLTERAYQLSSLLEGVMVLKATDILTVNFNYVTLGGCGGHERRKCMNIMLLACSLLLTVIWVVSNNFEKTVIICISLFSAKSYI